MIKQDLANGDTEHADTKDKILLKQKEVIPSYFLPYSLFLLGWIGSGAGRSLYNSMSTGMRPGNVLWGGCMTGGGTPNPQCLLVSLF